MTAYEFRSMKNRPYFMVLLVIMLTSILVAVLIHWTTNTHERKDYMEHIPYEMMAQHMKECLLSLNESLINEQKISEQSISEQKEWNRRIEAIYHGPDHDNAHKLLIDMIDTLDYRFIRWLFSAFFSSMTEDKLEISIRLMTRLIKGSGGWDGTEEMLEASLAPDNTIDPYLWGCLCDIFCYAESTPEEVMITIRRFLYSDDIDVVRASLALINGWFANNYFHNNKDMFEEIRILGENSNDLSIKKQVEEILDFYKLAEERLANPDATFE